MDSSSIKEMGHKKRVVDEWNRFCIQALSTNPIESFRRRLDRFMDEERWHLACLQELPCVDRLAFYNLLTLASCYI